MKTIVSVEIEIPEGYELAEPMMRKLKYGEFYLTADGSVCTVGNFVPDAVYPVLKKKWEPEEGKLYLFSNYPYTVGTATGHLTTFKGMQGNQYIDLNGDDWNYCWPIPKEIIGE